jgi:metal-responsive CopG/Arc/MetJ family transcriptional regulator
VPDESVVALAAAKSQSQAVTFRVPVPLLHKIDALARDGYLSRSEKMRQLLAAGLREAQRSEPLSAPLK